ncbi:branched-chain amino acid ABC transporter permease [Halospeciosus flavus]|uniref:branched-chain amino acid ABC transporter permease n=1 Tax=Halospeciosus flavus TaxID=3032283 RepID=UPI00362229A1
MFAGVNYTRTGKAILATSMSTKGAALVGVESERMYLYTWVIAGALAGLAGVFLGSIQTASWAMGRAPLVLSFSIVVLGGIGSIRGSLIGAYVIGFLEVFTVSYIDSSLSGLASLVVLVAILLVKPEGLFGRELAH